MFLDSHKIKKLCKSRKITLDQLLKKARVSKTAYYHLVRKNQLLMSSILELAINLGVETRQIISFHNQAEEEYFYLNSKLEKLCKKYPELNRENAWHTLQLLNEEPLQRLDRSLLRGQKINIY